MPSFACLENPFLVNLTENGRPIPWPLTLNMSAPQMELLELEENRGLQQLKSSCSSTIQFWKHVSQTKYPHTSRRAQRLICIFGVTCSCNSLYSALC
jgi:hypothetical protein